MTDAGPASPTAPREWTSDRVIVSIDLAHSRYANNGVVVMSESEESLRVELMDVPLSGAPDPAALAAYAVDLATSHDSRCILLDGPQGWRDPSADPSELRVCERRLAAPAKTGLPGQVKPANYAPFVTFSIAVFDALDRLGWRRLIAAEDLGEAQSLIAVESFPLAAWRSLQIPSLPAKAKARQEDISDRLRRLHALVPLRLNGDPTHDQLQAIVAGLAGFPDRFDVRLEGVAPRVIDRTWREGFIVLPRVKPGSHVAMASHTEPSIERRPRQIALAASSPVAQSSTKPKPSGYSTVPGFVNRNQQVVVQATGLPGTDHGQSIYALRCEPCGHEYGANGSDIWLRKCPKCQGGNAGLTY